MGVVVSIILIGFCIPATDKLPVDSNSNMTVLLCSHTEPNPCTSLTCENIGNLLRSPWLRPVAEYETVPWCIWLNHESEWNNITKIYPYNLAKSVRQEPRYNLILANT